MSVYVYKQGSGFLNLSGQSILADGGWAQTGAMDELYSGKKFYILGPNNALCGKGSNSQGQLGQGDAENIQDWRGIGSLVGCTKIACVNYGFYIAAVCFDGLYHFGSYGSSGNHTLISREPTLIDSGNDWSEVAVAYDHAFGIKNGALYAWGTMPVRTSSGSVINYASPTRIGAETGWTKIATGEGGLIGVRNGQLYLWGTTTTGNVDVPQLADGNTGWSYVATQAVLKRFAGIRNGCVYVMGENDEGQLGLGYTGSAVTSFVPSPTLTSGCTAVDLQAGGSKGLVLRNGTVWGWMRDNYYSQDCTSTPSELMPDGDFSGTFVSLADGYAIDAEGYVHSVWEDSNYGNPRLRLHADPIDDTRRYVDYRPVADGFVAIRKS